MFYHYRDLNEWVEFIPCYDPKKNLIYDKDKKMYMVARSAGYALYLLDKDTAENKDTAIKIIKKLLRFQNTDKNDVNFGSFPHSAYPFSLTDFPNSAYSATRDIGITFLQIMYYYDSSLPPSLKTTMKNACINASFFVLSDFSNLNILHQFQNVYLTVTTGERFDVPEFIKYGKQLLKNFHNSIIYHNSTFEYNDIEHTHKTLRLIQLFINENENSKCTKYAEEINDILWEIYAIHFHYGTMHPSGPFSLSVKDRITDSFSSFLYGSCNKKVPFPKPVRDSDEIAKCPPKYHRYFTENMGHVFFQRHVSKGMTYPFFRFSTVSSTYKPDNFSFGSFNREVFWESRKPFIGYFGTPENLYSFKLSVLHDGYDFSSAALHSVQYKGYALGHITIITDRGDKEIASDGPAGIIEAEDFRIRFSVSGNTEELRITHSKDFIEIHMDGVYIRYAIGYSEFEGYNLKTKFYEDDDNIYFDLILYSGKKRTVNFFEMAKAISEFSFVINETEVPMPAPEIKFENNILFSRLSAENMTLLLSTPVMPLNHVSCFTDDKQYINGKILENFVIETNRQTEKYIFTDRINQPKQSEVRIPVYSSEVFEITELINEIPKTNIKFLNKRISEIMRIITENQYSFILQKEFAFRISTSILECARETDYKLENIISRKYTDVFYKISMATDFEQICNLIHSTCKSIINDYENFTGNYKTHDAVNDMIKLINENITNPELSLKFIAHTLDYSPSHLSRAFYKEKQMNYIDYIQQQKIEYAIQHLKNSDISIKEIADRLNYSTSSSFMRMFHKITGVTVTQYLKSNL